MYKISYKRHPPINFTLFRLQPNFYNLVFQYTLPPPCFDNSLKLHKAPNSRVSIYLKSLPLILWKWDPTS
uniref:Uncharacterized protein n=2 Tax=Salix viminalis TaxID=40686 RepID=A0A6N2KK20_SALVM